jgi:hypothetical protein
LGCVDVQVQPEVIAAGSHRHHDFFESAIARALAQARIALRTGAIDAESRVASVPSRYRRDAGLAHTTLPDDRCAPAFDVPALKRACGRLGLPAGGSRATLVARLVGVRWVDEPVVMLAHTGLVRRCELLYFQSPYLDRTTLVVERLGNLRWATYAPTGGPGLFAHRAALRTYERARAGAWLDADEPLRIARAGRPDTPLSPWKRALEAVLAADCDADVLGALDAAGAPVRAQWALRLDREGRRAEASTESGAGVGRGREGDSVPCRSAIVKRQTVNRSAPDSGRSA